MPKQTNVTINYTMNAIREARQYIAILENGKINNWYRPIGISKNGSLRVQDIYGRDRWVKSEYLGTGKKWQETINKPLMEWKKL